MHTGGVVVFEPGLTFNDVNEALQARLEQAPLARKRLREVPLGGRPAWIDDPEFDRDVRIEVVDEVHVRRAAESLPKPGCCRECRGIRDDEHGVGRIPEEVNRRPSGVGEPVHEPFR
jgi:hypothetical protein